MSLSSLLRLLAVLLTLAVAALVARVALVEWRDYVQADAAIQAVEHLRLALRGAEMVSRERGPANGVLGSTWPTPPARLQDLAEARQRTDDSFDALARVLSMAGRDAAWLDAAERFAQGRLVLREARALVDGVGRRPKPERSSSELSGAVDAMVAVVPTLAPAIALLANEAQQAYPVLGDAVQSARMVAELREYAGLLGSHFTAALTGERPFTGLERRQIERTRGRIDELRFLASLRVHLPGQAGTVVQAWARSEARYFQDARRLVDAVLAAGDSDGRYGMDSAVFAARYVPDMNTLIALRDELLAEAGALAQAGRERSRNELLLAAGASVLLLSTLAVSLMVVQRRVLHPLAGTTRALEALARNDFDVELPPARFNDEMSAVIGAVQTLRTQVVERQQLERERDSLIELLRDQSNTDFLTGLPNRRAFVQAAGGCLARADRYGYATVVVVLDIDHFKQFNDTYGHVAGDQALVEVSKVIRRLPRLGDLVARFGGEEFVLLLDHCGVEQGLPFAERLRTSIADAALPSQGGQPRHVTVSVGLASTEHFGVDLTGLLLQADAAMYRAKHGGRNRVLVAGPLPDLD